MPKPEWLQSPVKGFLLDIYGVLFNSSVHGSETIKGSVEAIKQLRERSIPFRLCTNDSQRSHAKIVERLNGLGFAVEAHEVISPIQAAKKVIKDNNLRPYVIVHDEAIDEFKEIDQKNPNCVLIGDACDNFSYSALNEAFCVLMEHPVLYTMGYGRFYRFDDQLTLDIGAYSKALEYSANVKPTIIGKPSNEYFMMATEAMGLSAQEVVMIGDDIESDVKGAQDCGMRGVQVRTGKYRPADEPHASITPDGYVDNLKNAIDLLLENM